MRSLLDEEQLEQLKKMIHELEMMCGSSYTRVYSPEGKVDYKAVPDMRLYEIETYLMNSWNLKRYFLVGGRKVTQFEIERKLFEIKQWCYNRVFEMQRMILFTKPPIRI